MTCNVVFCQKKNLILSLFVSILVSNKNLAKKKNIITLKQCKNKTKKQICINIIIKRQLSRRCFGAIPSLSWFFVLPSQSYHCYPHLIQLFFQLTIVKTQAAKATKKQIKTIYINATTNHKNQAFLFNKWLSKKIQKGQHTHENMDTQHKDNTKSSYQQDNLFLHLTRYVLVFFTWI